MDLVWRFVAYFATAFVFLSIVMFLVNLYGPALLPITVVSAIFALALLASDRWFEAKQP